MTEPSLAKEASPRKQRESIMEFSDKLWTLGFRKIYLSHYDDGEKLARRFVQELPMFEWTVAADARKLGKDFVKKAIHDSDLLIVLNPDSDTSKLFLNYLGDIIEVDFP